MSIELVVAKALLGPALGHAGKKAAQWALGRADENKLVELCSSALGEALDEALEPYSPVQKSEREHLLGLLEIALSNATSSVGGMSTFGPDDSQQLVEAAHEHRMLDWKTFGLYRDELFYRLDEVAILEEFLRSLPSRIRDEAKRSSSALANLAHQLNYGELIRNLDSIRRTIESKAAVGTAQGVAEARTRALERQRSVVAARLADELSRPHYLDSGLMQQWLEWSATNNWSADVVEGLLEVVSALTGVADDLARLLEEEAAKTVAHPSTYSSLRLALSRLPLDEASTAISQAHTLPGVEAQYGRALRRLRWLNQQVEQPRFHHTFNVAGSFGSGTSRFLTRIAEAVDGSKDQVLFVSTRPGESFTNAILRRLSESYGLDFRDIRDTHLLLSDANREPRRLYLLVEDVDQQVVDESDLDELLDLIEATTAVPGIRWCLGANLDDLNAVLPSSRPYVWATYGFAPREKNDAAAGALGGWFNLDALNASRGVGLRLLQQLVAEDRPDLHAMLEHRQEFVSEGAAYANPLPAWMRYEAMALGRNSRAVSDPQDPDFIREYWDLLVRRHLRSDLRAGVEAARAEVESTVIALAKRLHTSGQPSVPLYKEGEANAPSAALKPGPSAALRRMGLLRLSYRGDPEVEALILAAVPVFAPFWGYRIGQLIVKGKTSEGNEASTSLDHDLRSWYQRAQDGEALAEAVCQFTLGALAEEGDNQRGHVIWQGWRADIDSPRVPFLMAGAAVSDQFSQFAIQLVTKPRYRPRTKRETFVMMRLVAKAPSPDWKADQRLAVLSTQRETVVDQGLHTYASHVTHAVLSVPELVERENFVTTCYALMGCERTGTAEIAAKLVADHGIRLFDSRDELVRYAMKFLQRVSRPPADGADTRKPKSKKRTKAPAKSANPLALTTPDGKAFPQRFIDVLLDRLVNGWDAAENVRVLERFGWWTASRQQIDGRLAFHMSQRLNLTFGRTVHRTGPDEAYVSVVEDLLEGTLLAHAHYQERFMIALYLIKHSVPTYGRWNLTVDRSLHPALLTLWMDRDFRNRQRDKLEPLCNANELPVD